MYIKESNNETSLSVVELNFLAVMVRVLIKVNEDNCIKKVVI